MTSLSTDFTEKLFADYKANAKYGAIENAVTHNGLLKSIETRQSEVENDFVFSIDLTKDEVSNQKASGRCWMFAALNTFRHKLISDFKLESFELSQAHTFFWDKYEKSNWFLEQIIATADQEIGSRKVKFLLDTPQQDGGQWDLFVNIVNKYGVVPKNAFPETFQSSNTNEIDGLLNKYIRKFAYDIRNNEENIEARKEKSIKEIYSILCSCFGIPPKTFTFEYVDKDKKYNIIKDLTPMKFYKEIVPINLDDYVSIINSPTDDKPFGKTYTVDYLGNVIEGNEVLYLNLEIERLKELAINQLKDGETVWFGSDCGKAGDREGGVWDDATFDIDTLFKINSQMSKGAMLDTRESAMNHAMVITGVNLDNETPTKWKIENSWRDEVADKGYYVATDSWFTKYVYQVVVNKKYLTKEERESLKAEKIRLKPWDPMGTLA